MGTPAQPTRQYFLADFESLGDGTEWPMVTYTFNDPDGLIQLLRRLPEDYRITFGPSDDEFWRDACDTMLSYSRAVEHNQRMITWYQAVQKGSGLGQPYGRWLKSDMVHVIATLWMIMYDQSLPFDSDGREWAEGLYSAIAQTLNIELV